MRFVRFKHFREDTSFAAAVPANAIGAGTAIATIDPLLKKKKKPISRLQKIASSRSRRYQTNP